MDEESLPSWKQVFRKGLAPLLPREGLRALAVALETDDPRLLQGVTTNPLALQFVQDWPCEMACAVGFCIWQSGQGDGSVADVNKEFARVCFACDKLMAEPNACRDFLIWQDETPRTTMRRELLAEVHAVLAQAKE